MWTKFLRSNWRFLVVWIFFLLLIIYGFYSRNTMMTVTALVGLGLSAYNGANAFMHKRE